MTSSSRGWSRNAVRSRRTEGGQTAFGARDTHHEADLGLPPFIAASSLTLAVSFSAYVRNPAVADFWAWLPASMTYIALGAAFPKARPRVSSISASMWLPWVGALVLVVVPLAVLIQGPRVGILPVLPDWPQINGGLLISSFAYSAMALGAVFGDSLVASRNTRFPQQPGPATAWAFMALAYVGAAIKLADQGGLSGYLGGQIPSPSDVGPTTLVGLLGTFLPAFGPIAGMLHLRRRGPDSGVGVLFVAIAGLLPMTVFSYNRGSWFFPLAVMIAVAVKLKPRFGGVIAVIGVLTVPLLLLGLGTFRTQAQWEAVGFQGELQTDPLSQLQGYANAPQHMAFALSVDPGTNTLLASLLAPVPAIGAGFRDSSGPVVFNEAVYGQGGALDQILPVAAELHWIGGPVAVLVGFGALGLLVGRLGWHTRREADPVRLYLMLIAGLWISLALMWSVSVLTQFFVYFWLVPYAVLRMTRLY